MKLRDPGHPVLNHRGFTIACPPLREFEERFNRLVANGEVSLVCHGPPRAGKTMANAHLRGVLQARNAMVLHWASIARDDKGRDGRESLYASLLLGERAELDLTPDNALRALLRKTYAEGDRLGTNKVLIAIDEAQNLTLEKLWMLKKLFDDLSEQGFAPFVLMMAQDEILGRIQKLYAGDHLALIDRFFTQVHRYRSLRLNEFKEVLAFYDTARWPEGYGSTYTEAFLPTLWANGWRLQDQSALFAGAFKKLSNDFSLTEDDVGMKYLVTAVRALLNVGAQDASKLKDCPSAIRYCVSESGFLQSFHLAAPAEDTPRRRGRK